MKGLALIIIGMASATVFAESATLSRACSLHERPDPTSRVLCRARTGSVLSELEATGVAGFYRARISTCTGYLTDSCVRGPTAGNRPTRTLAREPSASRSESLWLFGLFDLSRASVGYESGLSKGLSFGGGVGFNWFFSREFRLSPMVSFENLTVVRDLDGSGTLTNPNPTPVTQTLGYLNFALMAGYRMSDEATDSAEQIALEDGAFWLDAGLGMYQPLFASQQVRVFDSQSFSNPDRLWMAMVGTSAEFGLGGGWILGTRVLAFYNLAGTAGSRYFGIRLHASLGLVL